MELSVDLHENSHEIHAERLLQKTKMNRRYSLMPHALPLETFFVVSTRAIRSLGRQGGTKPLRGICYDDSSGDIRSFCEFFVEDVLSREKVLVESGCNFTSKGQFRCGVYGRQTHIWEWFVKCSPVTISYGSVVMATLGSMSTVLRRVIPRCGRRRRQRLKRGKLVSTEVW